MAVAKNARLVAAENVSPDARWLEFETADGGPLGFVGGQYIIVDTGLQLPTGKVAKRAYSLMSTDARQTRFEIVTKRLGEGPGSNYMHDLSVGSPLAFSGPWGKFVPDASLGKHKSLVVVTDTGITAGLGLLQGAGFASLLGQTALLWLTPSPDDFLSPPFVRGRIGGAFPEVRQVVVPPVGHSERVAVGLDGFLSCFRQAGPARVYLAGDGALLYPFAEALVATGFPASQVVIECFFNNPAKKIGVSPGGGAT